MMVRICILLLACTSLWADSYQDRQDDIRRQEIRAQERRMQIQRDEIKAQQQRMDAQKQEQKDQDKRLEEIPKQ